MTVQYVPANIAQQISGTDISERCTIVSNRYNIVATKTEPTDESVERLATKERGERQAFSDKGQ